MFKTKEKIVFSLLLIFIIILSVSFVSAKHRWWHFWGEEPSFSPLACKDCPNLKIRGDANNDCVIDISDVKKITDLYNNNLLFCNGAAYYEPADVNGDKNVDLSDAKYLSDYLFNYGKAPSSLSSGDSCKDTDGGKNYGVKGNTNVTNKTGTFSYIDSCVPEGGAVNEYFCNSDGKTYGKERKQCEFGCENGACKPSSGLADSCKDTDGENRNIRGNVNITNKTGTFSYIDYCSGGDVIEYVCNIDGKTKDSKLLKCEAGCENGACKLAVPDSCTDSDGNRTDVKGFTNATNSTGGVSKFADFCSDTNRLTEYICSNGKAVAQNLIWCPNGCFDGACKAAVGGSGGKILKVSQIVNSTTAGTTGDKVSLTNVRTGDVYDATITADGVGTIAIGGLVYTIRYKGTSGDESNWMEIEDLSTFPPEAKTGIQRAFRNSYIIIGNPEWNGVIARVTTILNSTSGVSGDKVQFTDFKTGDVYDVTMTAEGVGMVSVKGRSYTVKYYAPLESDYEDRYIHITGIDIDQRVFYRSFIVFSEEQTAPMCGNGIIETGEECDDSNNRDGDGCSGTCRIEATGEKSLNVKFIYPSANGQEVSGIVRVRAEATGVGLSRDDYPLNLSIYNSESLIGPSLFSGGSCSVGPGQLKICTWNQAWDWDSKPFIGNIAILHVNVSGDGLSASDSVFVKVVKPLPAQCVLTGASWNVTRARVGEQVALAVTGSDCEGLEVLFRPLEDDIFSGDDFVRINPQNAVFRNGVATSYWFVENQFDEGFTKPEYYFIAGLKDDATKNIKSGLLYVI